MAIINCPECNQKISDTAKACPKCGAPFANETHKISLYFLYPIWIVSFLFFLYSIGALIVSLLNRKCKFFFKQNLHEQYWSCVGDNISEYNAILIGLVSMITLVTLKLIINEISNK